MEKQELRTTEQVKYETIKAIVNNNLSKENASISLNLSTRQINRLILVYGTKGENSVKLNMHP